MLTAPPYRPKRQVFRRADAARYIVFEVYKFVETEWPQDDPAPFRWSEYARPTPQRFKEEQAWHDSLEPEKEYLLYQCPFCAWETSGKKPDTQRHCDVLLHICVWHGWKQMEIGVRKNGCYGPLREAHQQVLKGFDQLHKESMLDVGADQTADLAAITVALAHNWAQRVVTVTESQTMEHYRSFYSGAPDPSREVLSIYEVTLDKLTRR